MVPLGYGREEEMRKSEPMLFKQVDGAIPMKTLLARFAKDESGATAIEYGLIACLIAVAIITGAGLLGGALDQLFSDLADCVSDPSAANCTFGAAEPPAG